MVQYGEKVVHEFKLSDYKSVKDVVKRAQNIHQRGGEETNTALGINVARYRQFLWTPSVVPVLILVFPNLPFLFASRDFAAGPRLSGREDVAALRRS